MKLYHGSNVNIESINLAMCRPYKDFGKGFYLTDIEEQAKNMAVRVSRIYGGIPIVNVFGIQTTEEWAQFVMNNRSREFQEIKSELCNKDNKYDIVIGPVADDNMALLFRQYENEMIDFETLLRGIIYKRVSSQYSFHTEKSIMLLRKAEI